MVMGLPVLIATQTIVIVEPQTVLDHGAQVPDWDLPPASSTSVDGCSVQPAGGSEDRLHQDQIGALFSVWAPVGTVVGALSRVYVPGYAQPLRLSAKESHWSPGFLEHVELHLVAWEG